MIPGKKVFFRAIEERDLDSLREWANAPELSNLVVGWSFPISAAEQREWHAGAGSHPATRRFVVESYEEGPIGLTGLWHIDWHDRHALTALKLGPPQVRGKGYGTDAILTMMRYAFLDVGLNRLWSDILPFNVASYHVYVERCGWRVEGRQRQAVFRDGTFHDLYRVAVLREEFERHPSFDEYRTLGRRGLPEDRIVVEDRHRG